jgi:hypothetical protein
VVSQRTKLQYTSRDPHQAVQVFSRPNAVESTTKGTRFEGPMIRIDDYIDGTSLLKPLPFERRFFLCLVDFLDWRRDPSSLEQNKGPERSDADTSIITLSQMVSQRTKQQYTHNEVLTMQYKFFLGQKVVFCSAAFFDCWSMMISGAVSPNSLPNHRNLL